MFIRSFIAKGFKRFLSRDIKFLEINYTAALQILLGSNGSGKSSLMELLGGLPPEKKDFRKSGEVSLVIEYDGSVYEINYRIGKAVSCDFVRDGEELNQGHTAKIQMELIEEHLRYTRQIHGLMIGEELFTEMSPTKRREWFTRLSTVDMGYVLRTFNKARTNARDCKGALKNVEMRIAQTEAKLVAHDINDGTLVQIEKLSGNINELLSRVSRDTPDLDMASYKVEQLNEELTYTLNRAKKLNPLYNIHSAHVTSFESAIERKGQLASDISSTTERIKEAHKEQYEIDKLKHQVMEATKEDPDALDARLAMLEKRIAEYPLDAMFTFTGDVSGLIRDTSNVGYEFSAFISTIPMDVRPPRDTRSYDACADTLSKLNMQLHKVRKAVEDYQGIIRHVDHTPEEECPKCNHTFHKNLSRSKIAEVRQSLKDALHDEECLILDIKDTEETMELWSNYRDLVMKFKEFRRNYPTLGELWTTLTEDGCLNTVPSKAMTFFNRWENALLVHGDKFNDEQEYTKTKDVLREVSALRRHNDVNFITDRLHELERAIVTDEERVIRLKDEMTEIDSVVKRISEFNQAIEQLETIGKRIHEAQEILVDSHINKALNSAIVDEQSKLAILRQKQNAYDSLQSVLSDLKESKQQLLADEEVWKLAVQGLSHESGLIAKQVKGHIGVFVARMNLVISKVWTYDLTVGSCSAESGELDYKFPLTIPSKDFESKDIKYGSTGQKDIINFAFKVVAMEYLGIKNHPLFLDELGASFDAAHQDKLMHYLSTMLQSKECLQMFIINHFSSMYGGLANSEVTVLDSENIIVPNEYNTHVRMK